MIIPHKLKIGDEIRIIAPSRSMSLLSEENRNLAKAKLESLGFKVTYSKNCMESDMFVSSSIESRIEDIHDAFSDKNVKAIMTVIGGFNSNQLLKYIDYELIKNNPKIICGYSDITALTNAITAKTDLVTYSGIHFSNFAMKIEIEYNIEYFKKCLMSEEEFEIKPSSTYSYDAWYIDQDDRNLKPNIGFIILNKGKAEGKILGANLGTFNLLRGTEFMPNISNSILFLEEDNNVGDDFAVEFDRNLQALIQQPNFDKVEGIVLGRFQDNTNMTLEKIKYIIDTKKELQNIPIIANADFGHTNPLFTFPIGGTASFKADDKVELKILKH